MEETEIWKDVPGYEGYYQASTLGRVRSVDRYSNSRWGTRVKRIGQIIDKKPCKRGYIRLTLMKEGVRNSINKHQIIAMAFLNYKRGSYDMVVDHKDNNQLNNKLDNLQVITQRENSNKDRKGNTSKYRGVWKNRNRFTVSFCIGRNNPIHLGHFKEEKEAARHYEIAVENVDLYNGDKAQFREEIRSIALSNE